MAFLLIVGLCNSLASAATEKAFSIVKKSNAADNQMISRQTRAVKGRDKCNLKKRQRDSSWQFVDEAIVF